jgi:hypothetical protein
MSERPLLQVVRGEPTAEELSALIAVVTARAATAAQPVRKRSGWADPARRLRRPLSPGPGAWRHSARPL